MKKTAWKKVMPVLLLCLVVMLSGCASGKYKEAQALFAAQNYAEAQRIFSEIKDHEDSGKYLAYIAAMKEADAGHFAQASEAFAALSGFQDSDKCSVYYAARQAETEERYEDADALYQQLDLFKDSASRKNALPELIENRDQRNRAKRYAQGQTALSNGDYETAIAAFTELNNYEESSKYLMYARAMKLAEEGRYELAISSFASLEDFSDSKLQVAYYTARQAEAEQRYEDAELLYKSVATFRDSMDRMVKLHDMILDRDFAIVRTYALEDDGSLYYTYEYEIVTATLYSVYSDEPTKMLDQFDQLGDDVLAQGNWFIAEKIFGALEARNYEGAHLRVMDCWFAEAQEYMQRQKYGRASYVLRRLQDEGYEAADEALLECYYQAALMAEEAGQYADAYDYFTLAIPHADSAEKAAWFENEYAAAEELLAKGKFDEAIATFAALKNYNDAEERIPETYYKQGEALQAAGEWDAAAAAFKNAGNYSDAAERIVELYDKKAE